VTTAATDICNAHSRVVPEKAANATGVDGKVYRNTYRIAHTAKVMQGIGADIDDGTIQGRMRAAREYSGLASKYAPVVGSYQRLHNASCAVKRGEPGAKEDFYIASAEFAVDLVLIKEGVVYKAAFRTTGVASRTVGLNRLARVCGYKCVGLVQSELHWVVRGTYSGALDGVAREATEGNLTTEEWNESTRREVGAYVGNSTSATQIGSKLVPESKVIDCVSRNLGLGNLWKLRDELSKDGLEAIQTILREQTLPEDVDLSFLTDINKVDRCLGG
jgi:hypothetical protein